MGWLLNCLIFFACSCNDASSHGKLTTTKKDSLATLSKNAAAYRQIAAVRSNIKTGDLILRTGNDFTSTTLKMLNQREQTYSHCGIASIENDSVFVYHALGGEWNPDQKLRRDPIEVFGAPYDNIGIGIYRFNLTSTDTVSLMSTVNQLFVSGVMFDMDFDLKTDDHMYCAEFVSKAYSRGTGGRLIFPVSHLGNLDFVGVDDIFLHQQCQKLASIEYR